MLALTNDRTELQSRVRRLRSPVRGPHLISREYVERFNYIDRFNRYIAMATFRFSIQGWRFRYLAGLLTVALVNAWAYHLERTSPAVTTDALADGYSPIRIREFAQQVVAQWAARARAPAADAETHGLVAVVGR